MQSQLRGKEQRRHVSPSFEAAGNLGPSISNSAWSARDETDLAGLASEELSNSWDKNEGCPGHLLITSVGAEQLYHVPLMPGKNDIQEVPTHGFKIEDSGPSVGLCLPRVSAHRPASKGVRSTPAGHNCHADSVSKCEFMNIQQ
ncbi:hypothetical protein DSM25559_4377 [Agrobacterium rosae]|uniref:Uncharacterized protein n=1 Tax=Agrobacterium rosae TaxID=1972867 RepID=A0A1R3U811_9HYPH|nr:hypothetical protein DSM25559_4377 [Agrobacterium rosae]